MKTHFLLIIFLCWILTLSSCLAPTATKPLGYNNHKAYPQVGFITRIPEVKPQENIHVFFNGEMPKDKAYIKIGTLEQTVTETMPYGDVVRILRSKARIFGADAIFILGKSHTKQAVTDDEGEVLYHVGQKHISAVAIKYIKNIKNIAQYPKKETYYSYHIPTKEYELYLTNTLSLDGTVLRPKQRNFYEAFVYKCSLQHILKETGSAWRYLKNDDLVTSRINYNSVSNRYISYTITYDSLKRVQKVFNKTASEDISFFYNKTNQIVEKKIYGKAYELVITKDGREKFKPIKRGLVRKETLKYDKLGRLVEKEVFKIIKGKKMPWLKINYTAFYTQEDLKALSNDSYVE